MIRVGIGVSLAASLMAMASLVAPGSAAPSFASPADHAAGGGSFGPELTNEQLAEDAGAGAFGGTPHMPGVSGEIDAWAETAILLERQLGAATRADLAESGRAEIDPSELRYLCPDKLYDRAGAVNNHSYVQCGDDGAVVATQKAQLDASERLQLPPSPPPLVTGGQVQYWPCGSGTPVPIFAAVMMSDALTSATRSLRWAANLNLPIR